MDNSLFVKKTSSLYSILLVYVDDVILARDFMHEFQFIKDIFNLTFKIKDLGTLKYFLGLEVAHSSQGISICQRNYFLDLFNDSGLLGSKLVNTPSGPYIKLCHDNSPSQEDAPSYRRLVGRLIYLNTTRSDITFITQQLSQSLLNLNMTHYLVSCRVLRYLKHCPGQGLFFPRNSPLHVTGFSDAD